MKNAFILTSRLWASTLIGVANAQTGSGTLTVTATIQGSINLTFVTNASGIAVTPPAPRPWDWGTQVCMAAQCPRI